MRMGNSTVSIWVTWESYVKGRTGERKEMTAQKNKSSTCGLNLCRMTPFMYICTYVCKEIGEGLTLKCQSFFLTQTGQLCVLLSHNLLFGASFLPSVQQGCFICHINSQSHCTPMAFSPLPKCPSSLRGGRVSAGSLLSGRRVSCFRHDSVSPKFPPALLSVTQGRADITKL